jgi:hypothetical protein
MIVIFVDVACLNWFALFLQKKLDWAGYPVTAFQAVWPRRNIPLATTVLLSFIATAGGQVQFRSKACVAEACIDIGGNHVGEPWWLMPARWKVPRRPVPVLVRRPKPTAKKTGDSMMR